MAHHGKRQRHTRPPPYNPYSKSGRASTAIHNLKHQIIPVLIIALLLATWFLTPVADVITTVILFTVPVTTDVQLGLESWHTMLEKHPQKYQIIHDRWGIESIGLDLVDSVLAKKYNLDQFCDSIAQHLVSSPNRNDNSSARIITYIFNIIFNPRDICKQQVSQFNWSFQVIKSSDINAFALPGGLIRVTDSLLQTLHLSRGEIAALLGHEMSHVVYRHGQSQLLKKNLLQTIIQSLFYDDDDDDHHEESFGEAVHELLIRSASYLGELKFSRMNEYQADNGAWEILAHGEKYNPQNVQSLLEKLYSLEYASDTVGNQAKKKNAQSYLSAWDKTHPGTGDRIHVLEDKWNEMSWSERRKFEMRNL